MSLNLSEKDVVVRELVGGSFSTKSLVNIETVNTNGVFIEGCDGDFSEDSVYGYNFDGTPFASLIPGFKSTLLRKATKQDLIDYVYE
jgi:hypothetical protein